MLNTRSSVINWSCASEMHLSFQEPLHDRGARKPLTPQQRQSHIQSTIAVKHPVIAARFSHQKKKIFARHGSRV